MAIVIEEERKQSAGAVVGAVMWIVMLALIGAAVYYVFFKQPDLIEIAAPPGFRDTARLSELELNPQEVLESAAWKNLRPYITPVLRTDTGRQNPFLPI